MSVKYDAVIIGGRCAGAALATFLARDGAKVAMIDADARHSDVVVSTHTLHPAAMDVLAELGVASAIKQGAKPWTKWRFEISGASFDIPMPPGHEEHAPRRYFLDGLLQDAAQAAGAVFMDNTKLEALITDDGRVRGVRCDQARESIELEADLVVGADGRNSTVARLVGAEEYLGYDSPRGAYWAYWQIPGAWRTEAWPFQGYFSAGHAAVRFFFETNDDQILIGTAPPTETAVGWRSNHVDAYLDDLRRDPVLASLIKESKQVSEVRGTVRERYFFRRAAGPGWALIGDAGHHHDFSIGDGITQALQDARSLAVAIRAGVSDEALNRYWRERDVAAQPFFRLAQQTAEVNPPVRLNHLIFRRVGRSPNLIRRFWRQFEHDIDPLDAVPLTVAVKAVFDGLIRGQFGVFQEFLAEGKRISAVRAEGRRLRALRSETNSAALPSSSNGIPEHS